MIKLYSDIFTIVSRQEQIFKIIQDTSGIHVSGLIKESGFENGVIVYYLQQLEKQGKIKSQKRLKFLRYYLMDVTDDEFPVIRNMRKPTKKQILFQILVEGISSFQDLTIKINKALGIISWNLSALVDEGIIEKCKKDGKQCYKIKDKELFKKKKHFTRNFQNSLKKMMNMMKIFF